MLMVRATTSGVDPSLGEGPPATGMAGAQRAYRRAPRCQAARRVQTRLHGAAMPGGAAVPDSVGPPCQAGAKRLQNRPRPPMPPWAARPTTIRCGRTVRHSEVPMTNALGPLAETVLIHTLTRAMKRAGGALAEMSGQAVT